MTRLLLLALLCGCGGADVPLTGEELAASRQLSSSPYNQFACTTCHQVKPEDQRTLPGYALLGAARRPSYWGGAYFDLKSSVSFCLQYFMQSKPLGDLPREQTDALYQYLVSLGDQGDAQAKPLTIKLDAFAAPPAGGDCARGKALHQAACQVCHGAPYRGSGSGLDKAPELPEQAKQAALDLAQQLHRPDFLPWEVFQEKIRHGRFFLVGGWMPPFSVESLSEQDVEDLLWYYGLAPDQQPDQLCAP